MDRVFVIVSLLLLAMTPSVCSDSDRDPQAEFFAGVLLLQSHSGLSREVKARKFRELQQMTGISVAQAGLLLNGLREKPEKWQEIYMRMVPLLADSMTDVSKADTARAFAPNLK